MQMSNMSGVDVRGFGNKLFKYYVNIHKIGQYKLITYLDEHENSVFLVCLSVCSLLFVFKYTYNLLKCKNCSCKRKRCKL